MRAFRFRLDRVLDWRRTQLDLEEGRLKQLHAAVAALDRQRAELESAGAAARRDVSTREAVEGFDLHLLEAFRAAVRSQCERLQQERRKREAEIARQQQKLLEARRRLRLLENLRERRRAEWRYEMDREEESALVWRPAGPQSRIEPPA